MKLDTEYDKQKTVVNENVEFGRVGIENCG